MPAQRMATMDVNRKPNERIARLLGLVGKGPVTAPIACIGTTPGHGLHDTRWQIPNQGTAASGSRLLIASLDVRSQGHFGMPDGPLGPRRLWSAVFARCRRFGHEEGDAISGGEAETC